MKKNIGNIDRVLRVIIGCTVLGAGYYFKSWWGLLGLVPVLTAVFGFCPAYLPLGLDTCGTKRDE